MKNNLFMRLLLIFCGILIAAIGIQVIVTANVGVDSISTFILGLMKFTPLSFGRWSQILSFIFLSITFIVHKEAIGVASIIYVFLLGQILTITGPLMSDVNFGRFSVLMSLLGFLLYGFGISLYLAMRLGAGPIEGLMYILVKITNYPIRKARMINDFLFNVIGFLLGGPIGVGTLVGIFFLGFVIDYFEKTFTKLFANQLISSNK